jgi:hypothetical protein
MEKIVIPKQLIKAGKAYLELMGIDDFSVLPEIGGLAEKLSRKYFPKTFVKSLLGIQGYAMPKRHGF